MTQTRKEERPKKDEILLWALRFIFEGANQMRFDEETQETGLPVLIRLRAYPATERFFSRSNAILILLA